MPTRDQTEFNGCFKTGWVWNLEIISISLVLGEKKIKNKSMGKIYWGIWKAGLGLYNPMKISEEKFQTSRECCELLT